MVTCHKDFAIVYPHDTILTFTGDTMTTPLHADLNTATDQRIYANAGNRAVAALVDPGCRTILDIGCGAGDNAALIKAVHKSCEIYGITQSAPEAEIARQHLDGCWVADIEQDLPRDLTRRTFDTLIFSHVLEHLRNPAETVARFTRHLTPGGAVLIAVPNILAWQQRIQFVRGRFDYASYGVLDDSHLRFFTYHSADRMLLSLTPELTPIAKSVTGSIPLWILRRHLLPHSWCELLDRWGCRLWPNLFGQQILVKAVKSR